MKIISWSLLIIGILLLTFTGAAIVEYKWPGSVSWIILDIDYWVSYVWGWIRLTMFILAVVAVAGLIIFKVGPALVSLFQRHKPLIVAGGARVIQHPHGCRNIAIIVGVFIILFLIAGLLVAYMIGP